MTEYNTSVEERTDDVIATDGGTTVREAAEGAEILEDDDVDPWKGPFAEYDKYGSPTGAKFYRCRDCGREIIAEADREHVTHRDGCRFAEGSDAPQRHEPTNFDGSETTGVQDL